LILPGREGGKREKKEETNFEMKMKGNTLKRL
jgi:hypothetical protein